MPDHAQVQPAPPTGRTWQRWALAAVGAILLLSGLGRLGVFDRMGGQSQAVVGRWASDRSCQGATVLNGNGSFVAPNGSTGRWTLRGNQLTLSGANGSSTLRLISTTRNTLVVQGAEGAPETLVRC